MAHTNAETRSSRLSVEAVRESYVEAGKSRRRFAQDIGVAEQVIRRLENGRGISPANAKLVADHFGVRVADVQALAGQSA